MKKNILAVALVAALGCSMSAMAADGFYAGAQVGSSNSDLAGLTNHVDTAYGAFAGYRFHPNWSVEAAANNFGDMNQGTATAVTITNYNLSVVGNLPVANKIDLLGKVGYGRTHLNNTAGTNYNAANYGIGASYAVASNVDVRVMAEHMTASTTSNTFGVNTYSLAGVYKF